MKLNRILRIFRLQFICVPLNKLGGMAFFDHPLHQVGELLTVNVDPYPVADMGRPSLAMVKQEPEALDEVEEGPSESKLVVISGQFLTSSRWHIFDAVERKSYPLDDTSMTGVIAAFQDAESDSVLLEMGKLLKPVLMEIIRRFEEKKKSEQSPASSESEDNQGESILPVVAQELKHEAIQQTLSKPGLRRKKNKKIRLRFHCTLCNTTVPPSEKKKHMQEVHAKTEAKKLNRCHYCKECKISLPLDKKKEHIDEIHGGLPFVCDYCAQRFRGRNGRLNHMRKEHNVGIKEKVCPVCGITVDNMYSGKMAHHMMHHDKGVFACPQCDMTFQKKFSLNAHVLHHSRERKYCCEECGKRFLRKTNLNDHLAVHAPTKPFTCTVCNKGFTQRGYLKTHMRFHTGENPFTCDMCPQAFPAKSMLNSHRSTMHQIEKPFKCSVCDASFPSRLGLKRHELRKHALPN
ncbi:unnamed protein product [Cyprideis torosa]|uniref:Uncharacterized protein n=1 Tax=Cyprideis torosa TaxID=163714 RepID=A0A7R8ZR16_9CRUS|nr:unnamed protein product [Cyprideis torosa]CAG0897769.1 unnamed protein product [Cyprideis torosa]